jgi:hypothetical protein
MTRRTELESAMAQLVQACPDIELGIGVEFMTRIVKGSRQYGKFLPKSKDRRSMKRETIEELLDAVVYATRLLQQLEEG